jgi:FkbM family methyltransferase
MALLDTLRFVVGHPLNRGRPITSLYRFCAWQLRSRISQSPVAVNFAGGTRLLVSRGQTGATGNVYTGLHEFEEMAFVLHLLRPGDLFVDVGANVGSYTILAAGAVGARCISFEPDQETMRSLQRNVTANSLDDRVELRQSVVGRNEGVARFTSGSDTLNHVADGSDADATPIQMTSLDTALEGRSPHLLKVDVEGYELEVIAGASSTLQSRDTIAAILETNGSGARYGKSDAELHDVMTGHGFVPCTYEPFNRAITAGDRPAANANTIYIRNLDAAEQRVRSAPAFDIAGRRRI